MEVTGIVRFAGIEIHHVKQGPKCQKHTLAEVYKLWELYLFQLCSNRELKVTFKKQVTAFYEGVTKVYAE